MYYIYTYTYTYTYTTYIYTVYITYYIYVYTVVGFDGNKRDFIGDSWGLHMNFMEVQWDSMAFLWEFECFVGWELHWNFTESHGLSWEMLLDHGQTMDIFTDHFLAGHPGNDRRNDQKMI